MSVVKDGVGNLQIASVYFGSGSTVDLDMQNPAKSTVCKLEFVWI